MPEQKESFHDCLVPKVQTVSRDKRDADFFASRTLIGINIEISCPEDDTRMYRYIFTRFFNVLRPTLGVEMLRKLPLYCILAASLASCGQKDENSDRSTREAPELNVTKEVTLAVRGIDDNGATYEEASLYLTETDQFFNTTFLSISRMRSADGNHMPAIDCEQVRGDDCDISYFEEKEVQGNFTNIVFENNNPRLASSDSNLSRFGYETNNIRYEEYKEQNILKPGRILFVDKLYADDYTATAAVEIVKGGEENSESLTLKYRILSFEKR